MDVGIWCWQQMGEYRRGCSFVDGVPCFPGIPLDESCCCDADVTWFIWIFDEECRSVTREAGGAMLGLLSSNGGPIVGDKI